MVTRVSPSGSLKPSEGRGRGCPVLLTWGGEAHHPHRGRRAEKQWAVEAWLPRRPAGSQESGWGRGGSVPSSEQAESFKRLGSPQRDPECQRYPMATRREIFAMWLPGQRLSRAPEDGVQ